MLAILAADWQTIAKRLAKSVSGEAEADCTGRGALVAIGVAVADAAGSTAGVGATAGPSEGRLEVATADGAGALDVDCFFIVRFVCCLGVKE